MWPAAVQKTRSGVNWLGARGPYHASPSPSRLLSLRTSKGQKHLIIVHIMQCKFHCQRVFCRLLKCAPHSTMRLLVRFTPFKTSKRKTGQKNAIQNVQRQKHVVEFLSEINEQESQTQELRMLSSVTFNCQDTMIGFESKFSTVWKSTISQKFKSHVISLSWFQRSQDPGSLCEAIQSNWTAVNSA